jgi:hypothetical protein
MEGGGGFNLDPMLLDSAKTPLVNIKPYIIATHTQIKKNSKTSL